MSTLELISTRDRVLTPGRTFSTPGKPNVVSPLTDSEAREVCAAGWSVFGRDLASRNRLSAAQLYWLHKIALETKTPKPKASRTVTVGSLSGLVEFLKKAKEHLKYPRIRLAVPQVNGTLVTVNLSLTKVGDIKLTDGDLYVWNERFGREIPKYYGTVSAEGEFRPYGKQPEGMVTMLEAMAENPVQTSKEYGRLTGRCCFCGLKLEDERSTEVGYGPVCADHYELPWGGK
jgi:hypothetical protein